MQAYPVKFSNMLSTAQMVEKFAAFLADYVFSCSTHKLYELSFSLFVNI